MYVLVVVELVLCFHQCLTKVPFQWRTTQSADVSLITDAVINLEQEKDQHLSYAIPETTFNDFVTDDPVEPLPAPFEGGRGGDLS